MIGKTISHYKILEKLGEGGMGVVYKAQDTHLERPVALKFLPQHLGTDPDARSRFIQEAKSASSLEHTNICAVYDIDETVDGQLFIAMSCYEGESLKDKIGRGPLPIEEAVDYAIQIAQGLSLAHEAGIVHRDIKPGNVMITKKGVVKIVDFGLAKMAETSLTKTGKTLGTAMYMSPEQARGEKVDHRTDIWSVGVILYEMLTGKQSFHADYEQAVIYKLMNTDPQPVAEHRPEVPASLVSVASKLMQKDPNDRYADMGALLAELRSIQQTLTEVKKVEEKPEPSIAVLAFTNMSADPDQEYFCDGMAEEIINALTRIRGLKVIARTSAFTFKGQNIDVREVGRALNVEKLLEGSVRKSGNRLRINAQLINVEDGFHQWSEQYDRELGDVFLIQDEIASAIVASMSKAFTTTNFLPHRKRPDSLNAYDAYLKGRYQLNKLTADSVEKAIDYFNDAISEDASYALAFAGLAEAYLFYLGVREQVTRELLPKARAAAHQALQLDSSSADAYTVLGSIAFYYDWDRNAAELNFQKAIELNPKHVKSHMYYAIQKACLENDYLGAHRLLDRAEAIDPLDLLVKTWRAWVYWFQHKFDDMIVQCTNVIEIEPHFAQGHYWLGVSYLWKGLYAEALVELEKAITLGGRTNFHIGILGCIYALSGDEERANEMLSELIQSVNQGTGSSSYVARIYAALDQRDEVFKWLERAFEERDMALCFISGDIMFDDYRDDPSFTALIEKMGVQ